MGLIILEDESKDARSTAEQLLSDPYVANRIRAAQLLYNLGQKETALEQLLSELPEYGSDGVLTLALNVFSEIGENDKLPRTWLRDVAQRLQSIEYCARLARAALEE